MAEILKDPELVSQIESFALLPSDGGRYEFVVNDEMIFSKKQLGRHAEEGEIPKLLREHIAEDK